MKKYKLRNIIKESIKQLMNEQQMPVPGSVSPSPNPANARLVSWTYCDSTLLNYVAGPNSGTNTGMFFGNGIPGDKQLASDNNTPPTSNGPNDQTFTQCVTLGGGNIPQPGDGFKTAEVGVTTPYVQRDARVTSVSSCTSAWGGNTMDLPYACGSTGPSPDPDPVDPDPIDPVDPILSDDPCDLKTWENHAKTSFPQLASESYPLWKHHFCEYCIDGTIPPGTDPFCKCCKPTDADRDIEPTDIDKEKNPEIRDVIRESLKELLNEKQLLTEFYNCHCNPGGGSTYVGAPCVVTCHSPAVDERSAGCPDRWFTDTGSGCNSFDGNAYCRGGCLAKTATDDDPRMGYTGAVDFERGRGINKGKDFGTLRNKIR